MERRREPFRLGCSFFVGIPTPLCGQKASLKCATRRTRTQRRDTTWQKARPVEVPERFGQPTHSKQFDSSSLALTNFSGVLLLDD